MLSNQFLVNRACRAFELLGCDDDVGGISQFLEMGEDCVGFIDLNTRIEQYGNGPAHRRRLRVRATTTVACLNDLHHAGQHALGSIARVANRFLELLLRERSQPARLLCQVLVDPLRCERGTKVTRGFEYPA